MDKALLYTEALELLKQLIAIPSFSKEEEGTAALIRDFFHRHGVAVMQVGNNCLAVNEYFSADKPTILLNSHHDTVKPCPGYTHDPFSPFIKDGKLFGLGSNDAGGSLVALIATFLHYYPRNDLRYNLVMVASAEEEISGPGGISSVLPELGKIECAIVGEPTHMQMAVAERGLMVIDCLATGVSGHAARNEGVNALYIAWEDVQRIREHRFDKESILLGRTTMQVTVMETENKQHNVVPDQCRFVIDVRANEVYSFEEILEWLTLNLQSSVKVRSTRLRSTALPPDHPLVLAGLQMGKKTFGSSTLSDKALMPFPALKMGPGDSARSHTADEFIYLHEVEDGIDGYIALLDQFFRL